MSVLSESQPRASGSRGIHGWIRQHPLAAYFVWAYVGMWLFFAPLTLSERGLALLPINLSDGLGFALYALSTYAGPFLAAFVVTRVVEGKEGVRRLARRIVQWRVGIQWVLILLIGYPALLLFGVAIVENAFSLIKWGQNWPLLYNLYLPAILFGLLFPSLGEETGWRGFALPRLQAAYGPVLGSLILGIIHALWHLPAYAVRGPILENGWDTTQVIANSLAIITVTFIWTWLFNHGRGSILFAILIHATSNASSALVTAWMPVENADPWVLAKTFGVATLLLILFTRGRLGYARDHSGPSAHAATNQ